VLRCKPGVRSHWRFRNRGTDFLHKSGIHLKRMSGGAK
jgi:hypothetical protein